MEAFLVIRKNKRILKKLKDNKGSKDKEIEKGKEEEKRNQKLLKLTQLEKGIK